MRCKSIGNLTFNMYYVTCASYFYTTNFQFIFALLRSSEEIWQSLYISNTKIYFIFNYIIIYSFHRFEIISILLFLRISFKSWNWKLHLGIIKLLFHFHIINIILQIHSNITLRSSTLKKHTRVKFKNSMFQFILDKTIETSIKFQSHFPIESLSTTGMISEKRIYSGYQRYTVQGYSFLMEITGGQRA